MPSKGEQYIKIFRRAGQAWGKGDVHKAIAIVEEGLRLATAQGDENVVQILHRDLSRYQRLARGEEVGLDQV